MTYYVLCHKTQGVTAARSALLKSNNEVMEFPTKEAAETEATRLNTAMNHTFATCLYRYEVIDVQRALSFSLERVGAAKRRRDRL